MKFLIDTNVLVDALRLKAESIDYLKTLGDGNFVASVTVTELFAGVRSDKQKKNLLTLLGGLHTVDFSRRHAELAGEYIKQYGRSHAVTFVDAAIAATAQLEKLQLVTLNRKHFPMFTGLKRPY